MRLGDPGAAFTCRMASNRNRDGSESWPRRRRDTLAACPSFDSGSLAKLRELRLYPIWPVSRSHEQIIGEGQSRHPSDGRGGVPPCGAILAARGSRTRGPRAVVVGATVRSGFVQGCGTAIELVASFERRQRRILRRPLRGWRRNSTSSRRTSRTDGSFTTVPRSGEGSAQGCLVSVRTSKARALAAWLAARGVPVVISNASAPGPRCAPRNRAPAPRSAQPAPRGAADVA
jgi:hypothetical protein